MKTSAKKLLELPLAHRVYGGGDRRAAWIVVEDPYAGKRRVYTVYRLSLTGSKEASVIGRELPLQAARAVIRRDMEVVR